MEVKEFLSVCNFMPERIADKNNNIYFLNGIKCAHYEDIKIDHVMKNNSYIEIILDTYGYDGEYERRMI